MKPMERYLTAEEMARPNAVLVGDEFWCPHIVAIARSPVTPTLPTIIWSRRR